jgi:hypothetical protein
LKEGGVTGGEYVEGEGVVGGAVALFSTAGIEVRTGGAYVKLEVTKLEIDEFDGLLRLGGRRT